MADSTVATAPKQKTEVKPVAQAAPPAEPAKPLTLAQRLAAIRAESFGIGKDNIKMSYFDKKSGERKEFSIKGHTVEAVLSEMRPLLESAGVLLIPNLVERTYSGNRCDVLVAFEWENLDNAEDRRVIRWAGAGCDDGDKGFSKAGTNALKEHLKKLFLITDRDDAKEEEEKVEHKTDEGISRAQVDKVAEKAREATEKWASTFRLAVMKAKSEKEIARLYRDASKQLGELPEVTRHFFADLREKRTKEVQAPKEPETTPTPEEQLAMDQRLAEEEGRE